MSELRWTTQREVCQELLRLLAETDGRARARIVSTLCLIAEEGQHPMLRHLLMQRDPEPWVRIYALQTLEDYGALSEADVDALLLEFLPLLNQRRHNAIGAEEIVAVFEQSAAPAQHASRLSVLSVQGLNKLLRADLPGPIQDAAVARWLSMVDFSHIREREVGWRLLGRADVRHRLIAEQVPLLSGPLMSALRGQTPAWIDAVFDGAPRLRAQAEAAFCLPLELLDLERETLIASLHRCLVDAVGEARLPSRASNAVLLLYALDVREETRTWNDIHPAAYFRLHPPQRGRISQTLSEEITAIEDREDVRLQAVLCSTDDVTRYLAVEHLSTFDGAERPLERIAASDAEPIIRIAAVGGLALDDAQWDAPLLAAAGDVDAHVCTRAEALRWLGRQDPIAHRDVFIHALLHDHARLGADNTPAADEAAMWLARCPDDVAMTALLQAHLKPASMDTGSFLRDSIRYRLGKSDKPPSWQFSWRWRYLKSPCSVR